ncbi:MAG: FAD-dependent oxidoreductase [Proteobacteria bacterium]|nr:FAD-dependent oxidoreductase [Pseudomonadota bacterium]
MNVTVVGAGIAGLTAAWRLQRAGCDVVVVEASDRPGGRMTTDLIDGHAVDRGAQFLSTRYRVILDLLREFDLEAQWCESTQRSAIVKGGRPLAMEATRPLDARQLVPTASLLRLAWHRWRSARRVERADTSSYASWAAVDDVTLSGWLRQHAGQDVLEYIFEPMVHGFYFQTPEETSFALGMVLMEFGVRRSRTCALRDGLGVLPQALAGRLDVRYESPVISIERRDGCFAVQATAGVVATDGVVVAVPAPMAKRILVSSGTPLDLDTAARDLLLTEYSASINVACLLDEAFELPDPLRCCYGLLVPRLERGAIAAVGIENNKRPTAHGRACHLNLMFDADAAQAHMRDDEAAIVDVALRDVRPWLGDLSRHVRQSRVFRWPLAEPKSRVGRARLIATYRQHCACDGPKVVLAGDYVGMPFTEGAAESGEWAASSLLAAMTGESSAA